MMCSFQAQSIGPIIVLMISFLFPLLVSGVDTAAPFDCQIRVILVNCSPTFYKLTSEDSTFVLNTLLKSYSESSALTGVDVASVTLVEKKLKAGEGTDNASARIPQDGQAPEAQQSKSSLLFTFKLNGSHISNPESHHSSYSLGRQPTPLAVMKRDLESIFCQTLNQGLVSSFRNHVEECIMDGDFSFFQNADRRLQVTTSFSESVEQDVETILLGVHSAMREDEMQFFDDAWKETFNMLQTRVNVTQVITEVQMLYGSDDGHRLRGRRLQRTTSSAFVMFYNRVYGECRGCVSDTNDLSNDVPYHRHLITMMKEGAHVDIDPAVARRSFETNLCKRLLNGPFQYFHSLVGCVVEF